LKFCKKLVKDHSQQYKLAEIWEIGLKPWTTQDSTTLDPELKMSLSLYNSVAYSLGITTVVRKSRGGMHVQLE